MCFHDLFLTSFLVHKIKQVNNIDDVCFLFKKKIYLTAANPTKSTTVFREVIIRQVFKNMNNCKINEKY